MASSTETVDRSNSRHAQHGNMDHLCENLAAIDVPLTPADLREIEAALSGITVYGGRMNEAQMRIVDQTV